MEDRETTFNDMQMVKRRFFALRNGVIADVLRRGGSPFRIIFGLNLPQIVEIAHSTPHSMDLAERLWANSTTRESMLLAPMLVDVEAFTPDDAIRWISAVPSREVADVLCLKLLKRLPYAQALTDSLHADQNELMRYTGLRLMFNLLNVSPCDALAYARKSLETETDASNVALARSLEQECLFMIEE